MRGSRAHAGAQVDLPLHSPHGSAVWPCVITFTEALCATSW